VTLASVLALALGGVSAAQQERPPMEVHYRPDAKRPYDPKEKVWQGEPPCARFPPQGEGTVSLDPSGEVTPPKLISRHRGDYSKLTSATRLFQPFVAELIVGTEGYITEVTVVRSVSDEFDELILGEFESSVYEPGTLQGKPVSVCMFVTARPHP